MREIQVFQEAIHISDERIAVMLALAKKEGRSSYAIQDLRAVFDDALNDCYQRFMKGKRLSLRRNSNFSKQ